MPRCRVYKLQNVYFTSLALFTTRRWIHLSTKVVDISTSYVLLLSDPEEADRR